MEQPEDSAGVSLNSTDDNADGGEPEEEPECSGEEPGQNDPDGEGEDDIEPDEEINEGKEIEQMPDSSTASYSASLPTHSMGGTT